MANRSRVIALALPMLCATAALLAACGGSSVDDLGESTIPPASEVDAGIVTFDIVIYDDAIDPADLTLQVPNEIRLNVRNESSDACDFSFGSFASASIESSAETQLVFTADVTSSDPAPATMGCAGSDGRSGAITFEKVGGVG